MGQSGSVFFLVGAFGGEKVVRNDCTVPAGKALFFPLVNVFDANNPGENRTARELWREMEAGLSFANLHASVDGIPVGKLRRYRACAGPVHRCAHPFSITLPDDNIFNAPAGIYTPAVADGIYLLLKPLAPGRHTITFGGTGRSDITGPFSADITYHLTVRPGHHHVHDRYASSSDK
ncbi:hypothetical protein CcI156_16175 [Frankia sp. CcI156]|nr:hypothetical protein CgIS1_15960 [Frankia sp. CgIS1]ONH24325.1 hypothetical protein CcI156_16175 [Frankia sp. CcI156]